jgi:hypothetical protein
MAMPTNLNIEELIYDGKDALSINALSAGLKKVRIKGIKQLGINFRDNLKLVENMVMLPLVLLSLEHYQRALVPYEVVAAVKSRIQKKSFSEARKEVFESDVLPKRRATINEAIDSAEKEFLDLLQGNWGELRNTYEALLFSGSVWIWCSFEILTKELWELALNCGGSYTSKNVVSKLSNLEHRGSIDLLRGRYISLDYLARHGYNISDKLGSALSCKFDFTSVNGIKEAYLCAFPKSANIKDALEDKGIVGLEATRNVVVHNAGVVDEAFCKKLNASKSAIGKRLQLNSHKLFYYGNSSIDVGLRVMTAVSSILSYAKSLKQEEK